MEDFECRILHHLAPAGRAHRKGRGRIPKNVRAAIKLLVHGRESDDEHTPLDFIEAAKETGVKPDVMRRWFDYPHFCALLRAERKAFREAVCAGNEGALRRVRDTSGNGMVVVAAVRGLEQLDTEDGHRPKSDQTTPGIVIRIINDANRPGPRDVTPPADHRARGHTL